jgi:integrase
MGLPSGDTVFDYRDRAIIKFFLYSGARIGTACRLQVKDFHQDGDEATVTLHEKGDKHRRIGLHFAAAEAISAYIAKAEITKGPLFRARLNPRSQKLGRSRIGAVTMYRLMQCYLARLPSSMREEEVTVEDGSVGKVARCIYTPHSLRATTATLLLDAGGGHHQGQGAARPPAPDDDADLRQAAAEPERGSLARRADLNGVPCPSVLSRFSPKWVMGRSSPLARR